MELEVRAAALEMDSVRPVIFNTSYIGAIKNDEMTYTIDAEKNKQGSLQSTKVREAPKNEDYLEQQRRKQSMREQLLDKNPLKNPDTLTAKEEKVFACENEVKKLQDKLGDNAKAVKQSPSVLHQASDLFLHGDRNASLKANLEQRSEILQKLKAENEKLDGLLDQAIAERGFKIDKPQGQNEERTLTIGQQRLWDAANADQRAPQIEKIGAQRAGAKIGDALGGNQVPKEVGQGPAVHRQ